MDLQKLTSIAEVTEKAPSATMDVERTTKIIEVTNGACSDSNSEPSIVIDHDAERRLTRKLDFRLLPVCYLLCLVGFLDKVNIGNARIQGLEKELHMDPKSNQFNVALSIFWVPYILSEVPSNIILKNVDPSTYLSIVTVLFGVACMCQGFVHNFTGLVVCRLFLGLFESAISPGTAYLISMYYPRWEIQRRYSILWTNGFVAGAFGGLFAFALSKMDGISRLSGWRWIFIVEGILTIVVGLVAKIFLFDWPSSTNKLTADEKALLRSKMEHDGEKARMDRLDRKAIKRIACDWKIYIGALLFFSISISSASIGYFMPTILREFGYSSSEAQIHTIPVWMVSAVVTIVVGWLSDRFRRRAIFVFSGCVIATVGYIILLCQGPHHGGLPVGVKYLAIFITCTGVFTVQPIVVIWLLTNLAGNYKRAIGISFQVGWGNLGSIVASNIFLTREAPRFFTGYGVALGFIGVEAILAVAFMVGLKRENKKRDRGERNDRFNLPKEEVENLGDDHPDFRFHF